MTLPSDIGIERLIHKLYSQGWERHHISSTCVFEVPRSFVAFPDYFVRYAEPEEKHTGFVTAYCTSRLSAEHIIVADLGIWPDEDTLQIQAMVVAREIYRQALCLGT